MAKIIKAVDWEGDFLNIYEQIERKDLAPNAIEHKWTPHGVAKQGTPLNANFLNEIQKNSVYGILETNYKITDNIDKYTIMNFDGINDIGVFKDLKIKVLITTTNRYDSPKIIINSKEYSILYSVKDGIQALKKGLFIENHVYNMTYNGTGFVIENGNFKATENELGLVSLNDVRNEVSSLNGAPYNGIFGASLKNVKAGNTYYYLDLSRNVYVSYVALRDISNSNGILTPDTLNFNNVSNLDLSRRGSRNIAIVNMGGWVALSPTSGNWSYTYAYPATLAYENILCARLTVETWTNAYVDSVQTVIAYKNDSVAHRYYDKNYDILNNAAFFSFGMDVSQAGITINFINNSTTLPINMRIRELKVFY